MPQGSCAGAQLFNLYSSTIQEERNPPLNLHGFADDHTVENKFKPGDCGEECEMYVQIGEMCGRPEGMDE